jgi:insertion element IS1 protein InsB
MEIEQSCPTCGSHDIMKNGTTRRGKQNYKCKDCGRQFVEDPQWKPKDRDTVSLINLLLVEKIPLAGIARATGVSKSWLQKYVNNFYETVPQEVEVLPKVNGKLVVQMDELWSFVAKMAQRAKNVQVSFKPLLGKVLSETSFQKPLQTCMAFHRKDKSDA